MALACGSWGRDAGIPPARPAAGAVDPFLSLLHSISSALSHKDLSTMKFLCRDKIPKGKLEAVQSGLELFTVLMEKQEIASDDVEFLRELLQHVGRDDLVSRLRQFEEEERAGEQPDAHEKLLLKEAMDIICDNVGREWKWPMRQLGMSETELDRIENARPDLRERLMRALWLWQRGKGKDAKVADLINALRRCSMNLVADVVEERISQLNTGTR